MMKMCFKNPKAPHWVKERSPIYGDSGRGNGAQFSIDSWKSTRYWRSLLKQIMSTVISYRFPRVSEREGLKAQLIE